ncbi:MAG: hypothetical protein KTR19_09530 [Hyphomicrobiales bacterium]|nr:hypothetical protein [Hyphomicrobiales bacterium]
MDFLKEFGARYEGMFAILSLLIGLSGILYVGWRRQQEHKAKSSLDQKQKELDDALGRLKHLETYASGFKSYDKAV